MSFSCISPIDGRVVCEREHATREEIGEALDRANMAHKEWRRVPLRERVARLERFVDAICERADDHARELTLQIGRPIAHSPYELKGGFQERARHMLSIAESALADVPGPDTPGFRRFVRKEPHGTVFVMAAWNYPWMIAVNSVVPALAAGNTVLLKHSAQTPLCAEGFRAGMEAADMPEGVFGILHLTHQSALAMAADKRVGHVVLTGSVEAGHVMRDATSKRFVGTGLELGGNDPAYVRPDAHIEATAVNVCDGSFFNAGQSCCAIERVYVHEAVYDHFLDALVEETYKLRLGDPLDPETTLGPVVRRRAADTIRATVQAAASQGARRLIDPARFPKDEPGGLYLAPQILVDVDHGMDCMREEVFGPVVSVMPVRSDEDAVAFMNDSRYGLTASVWTEDPEAALRIGAELETGTCFMNRCDYVDPALTWTGVKDTGLGWALSPLGYDQLTHPKSYHLKLKL